MKRDIYYSFDNYDPQHLSLGRLEEIYSLLRGHLVDDEDDKKAPCAGIKAYRKIKGNIFTADDLFAYLAFASELVVRARDKLGDVKKEREIIPKDPESLRAYDLLIEGLESAAKRGDLMISEYREAFLEEFPDAQPAVTAPSMP